MSRTVTIVGCGPGDPGLITIAAHNAILDADIIIGAKRLLESLPEQAHAARHEATRARDIVSILQDEASWTCAAIVMSGDVGMFSGATSLRDGLADLSDCKVSSIPGISSTVYFASALGRPWQDWKTVSAHGVACDIAREARSNAELFLVTGGSNTVDVLCKDLTQAGLGAYRVSVGERLSYPDERIVQGTAEELAQQTFDTLAVMLVEPPAGAVFAQENSAWPWVTHGLPDSAFTRGPVPMTKQDVRAVALSHLKLASTDVVYDVGAGTGSVSIELALQCPYGHVYAIERKAEGIELIEQNAQTFGLNNISIIEGKAPAALEELPAPDAAFIGGSGAELENIVHLLLDKNPRVRICVTCVTLETLAQALSVLQGPGLECFEASCINAANARVAGPYHLMNAENPVYVLTAQGSGTACDAAEKEKR